VWETIVYRSYLDLVYSALKNGLSPVEWLRDLRVRVAETNSISRRSLPFAGKTGRTGVAYQFHAGRTTGTTDATRR
jgi:hypothetical protein